MTDNNEIDPVVQIVMIAVGILAFLASTIFGVMQFAEGNTGFAILWFLVLEWFAVMAVCLVAAGLTMGVLAIARKARSQ